MTTRDQRFPRSPRSARFQLGLIGLAYAGAVVLALTAALLRSILFEPFIREKPPGTPEQIEALTRTFASGTATPAEWDALTPESAAALWWICVEEGGGNGWIDELFSRHAETIMRRARRSLVVGNVEQRYRVVGVLARARGPSSKERAKRLCEFALRRARARGEDELVRHALQVLGELRRE